MGNTGQVIHDPGYSINVYPCVSVQKGHSITIPCTFTADGRNTFSNSSGYWRRMPLYPEYIVATNDKSSDVKKQNFYLMGNPDTGDCTLTITDARREDEGRYFFKFVERKDKTVKYFYKKAITYVAVTGEEYISGYSIDVDSCISVQEGLCVTIPCTFTADGRNTFSNSHGYWRRTPYESDYIVATNDKSSDVKKPNFYLTGNPDTGDCTLTITDAGREDNGSYYFRFEGSKESPVKYHYVREKTTTITVTDLSEEPVISDLGTVTAGIDKTVTCSLPGNCSATSFVFQWKKSDVSGIWKTSPTITFTPSLDDHQKTITCEITNSKGKTTKKTILLDVYESKFTIGLLIGGTIIAIAILFFGIIFFVRRNKKKSDLGEPSILTRTPPKKIKVEEKEEEIYENVSAVRPKDGTHYPMKAIDEPEENIYANS
ncbi:sialic acid-binding Ig-like lectin 12 [Dendropsophus ebraccatus]|uniref:sialic acid-binding Ig-like lectin 12 n=1 Tax=Dendropsophus ebraccatus TaxID=150705 RepID=UPI0038312F54